MKHIGEYIKQIRLEKNLSQKNVINQIGSVAYLSKIENGKTNPTYSNLLKILNRLNLNPNEFYRATRSYNNDTQTDFIKRFDYLIREEDIYLINLEIEKEISLLEKDENYRHEHNIILLKQYRNYFLDIPSDSQQIRSLSDYLFNIESWGAYEINLYNLCILLFSNDLNKNLYRVAINSLKKYLSDDQYYTYVVRIGFNIINKCILSEDFSETETVITSLEGILTNSKYYYDIVKLTYIKGLYEIKKGNIQEGTKLAENAVHKMYEFGDEANARAHKRKLQESLET